MQAVATDRLRVTWATYAGLFVITMATLMYEILLTRIFSVTMWYHFAFVAISVALFGMTVGAMIVYLLPERFPKERVKERLAQSSLLFSVSIVLSFLTLLSIPFDPDTSLVGIYSVTLTYLVTSVPFVFGGIAVSLALTKFPSQLNRLYAVDLVGAAIGAVGLVWLLRVVDGQSAVIAIAALVALGCVLFALDAGMQTLTRLALIGSLALVALSSLNVYSVGREEPIVGIKYAKGREEGNYLWEKWNAFSRIQVVGDPNQRARPWGWGLSTTIPDTYRVRQVFIYIDSFAGTVLTNYNGDPSTVSYLKYDVTNLGQHLRSNADVAVIGVGGGRDVLSALAFDQKSVRGVEINGAILEAVNGQFGDFTGHLDRNPKVNFVNDEARSYFTRTDDTYDIIQVSLIDTFAATGAGAFALSENGLYTRQSFDTLLDRLRPGGILSVSRIYFPNEPVDVYRLTSLAAQTLRDRGITDFRSHMIVVKSPRLATANFPVQVATLLLSPTPFSQQDIATLNQVVGEMKFDKVLTPDHALDKTFEGLGSPDTLDATVKHFAWDISAPTDNRPFFFQQVRMRDIFNGKLFASSDYLDTHLTQPVRLLGILAIAVVVATSVFIVFPLFMTTKRSSLRGMGPFFVFFAAIGLAFLLIEIAQLQRLAIFLGHPTYALSVVLFSLLLASGVGSLASERLVSVNPHLRLTGMWPFAALLIVIMTFGIVTPMIIDSLAGATTPARIAAATAILLPMGLVMGLPFPVGMKVASLRPNAPTVFLWGINGATSVTASVLAVAIALGWGISTAFWAGAACYLIAVLALGYIALQRE